MKFNFSKFAATLALGLFTIGFTASGSVAGVHELEIKANSGVIYEKPACPEGQDWNEDTKACEAPKEK